VKIQFLVFNLIEISWWFSFNFQKIFYLNANIKISKAKSIIAKVIPVIFLVLLLKNAPIV
jgi:hypothetical protein